MARASRGAGERLVCDLVDQAVLERKLLVPAYA